MTKLEDWIDYMEGEAAEMTRERLKLLLAHSKDDRLIFKNLRRLRQLILHADPADAIETILENDRLMLDLHDRIMMNVKVETSRSALRLARRSKSVSSNPR